MITIMFQLTGTGILVLGFTERMPCSSSHDMRYPQGLAACDMVDVLDRQSMSSSGLMLLAMPAAALMSDIYEDHKDEDGASLP
jgi:hypothetical protein